MDKILRLLNTIILIAILTVLVIIDHRIPPPLPTAGEWEATKKDRQKRLAIQHRMPQVAINGSVSVENDLNNPLEIQTTLGSIDVQVSSPVEVRTDARDPLYIQTDPTGGHRLQIDDRKPIEVQIVQGQ